jgi:phosphohistidine swiveling domain-containing protein
MLIGQGAFERVLALCHAAGRPDLANELIGGDLVELQMLADLWRVSRGTGNLEKFVTDHGFHGPDEGEMRNPTWREDPTPLQALVRTYRSLDEDRGPAAVHRRRLQRRATAEAELLKALRPARRAEARLVLPLARRVIPYREIGKTAFLRCVDAGRAAARILGGALVEKGLAGDIDDVFMLTVDELLTGPQQHWPALIAERLALHEQYSRHQVPDLFDGLPTPLPITTETRTDLSLVEGVAVAPGRATGKARVIIDPATAELEPGDVLVCHTTDPSWITLFLLASAVVIDVGGPMSHGAIVARELGIPCVINTRDGTRRIPDGAHVEVDGTAGSVSVRPDSPRADRATTASRAAARGQSSALFGS